MNNDFMIRTTCESSEGDDMEMTTLQYCTVEFLDYDAEENEDGDETSVADVKLRFVYPWGEYEDTVEELDTEDADLGCYFKFLIHKNLHIANVVCLQRMYLNKEYRGRGCGSYILDSILDKAIRRANPLLLETSYIVVGIIRPDEEKDIDKEKMTEQIIKMLEKRDFVIEKYNGDLYFYKDFPIC